MNNCTTPTWVTCKPVTFAAVLCGAVAAKEVNVVAVEVLLDPLEATDPQDRFPDVSESNAWPADDGNAVGRTRL